MKKEMADDIICTKPQPWLMFHSEPCITKDNRDKGVGLCSAVTDLWRKKGGMAFSIEYKSIVPKLQPINVARNQGPKGEDYCNWKMSGMYMYIKRVVIEK